MKATKGPEIMTHETTSCLEKALKGMQVDNTYNYI
jgi:hypothetical protein